MMDMHEAARTAGVPFEQPHRPSTKEFRTPNLTLKYLEWGRPSAPPILLLHGFAQTAHSWDFTALALADRYHVICVDARGHGDSEWANDADYSHTAHQKDLDALLRHLAVPKITIVGLSMGGGSAYTFAARHPEVMRGLVIVDTGPEGNPKGRDRIRTFVALPDVLDSFDEFVERVHEYNPTRPLEQIKSTLGYNIRQRQDGKWIWKYDPILRDPKRPRKGLTPDEAWNLLRSINTPTLLIRGANSDVLTVESAHRMTVEMPNCISATVDDAGHLVPGDNPSGFLSVLIPWLDDIHENHL